MEKKYWLEVTKSGYRVVTEPSLFWGHCRVVNSGEKNGKYVAINTVYYDLATNQVTLKGYRTGNPNSKFVAMEMVSFKRKSSRSKFNYGASLLVEVNKRENSLKIYTLNERDPYEFKIKEKFGSLKGISVNLKEEYVSLICSNPAASTRFEMC